VLAIAWFELKTKLKLLSTYVYFVILTALDSDSGGELAFKAAAARGIARCANMLSLSRKPQP